jgi:hypothetical protein
MAFQSAAALEIGFGSKLGRHDDQLLRYIGFPLVEGGMMIMLAITMI